MTRENSTKYLIFELIAVAFLATGGIFIRFCGISPVNCGFYRILFSLPFLYPFARKHFHLLGRREVILLLVSGIFFATDIGCAYIAFEHTTVANVNLLCTLTPLTIIPASYFIFKEKISKFYILGVIVTIIGVVLLIGGKVNPTSSNYFGDILAFLSSVFYSLFLLISYRLRDKLPGSVILFVAGIGSVITFFVYASLLEGFQLPKTMPDFLLLLGLSLSVQVVGQSLFTYCQGKMNVNISSIVGLSQPVFAAGLAFLFFQEKLSLLEMLGVIVVAFGIYLVKMQYSSK